MLLVAFAASATMACSSNASGAGGGMVLRIVAAENFWGSIATQLGGTKVKVTSIITNPNTDPHDYEATPKDGRTLAGAQYVIYNGIGYDPWAAKLLASNPAGSRRVLEVGALLGLKEGDNPHRWYAPADVQKVIQQIVSDFKQADPQDAAYFDQQQSSYTTTALQRYNGLISQIKQQTAPASH